MSEDQLGGASGGPPALLHTSLLYQRLEALGLSGHVRCWFLRKLDGSAGALVVDDRSAFLKALRATGRFCEDSSRGSMLHGGHRSFREMATGSGDALHVTAAAGDYLRAHLDRVSPSPDATLDGRCRYRSRRRSPYPPGCRAAPPAPPGRGLGNRRPGQAPQAGTATVRRAALAAGAVLNERGQVSRDFRLKATSRGGRVPRSSYGTHDRPRRTISSTAWG